MNPTINISEYPPQTTVAAAIGVVLQGFTVGEKITLSFWEDDTPDLDSLAPGTDIQAVGTITGEVVPFKTVGNSTVLSLKPESSSRAVQSGPMLAVIFEQAGGATPEKVTLLMPQTAADQFEGDSWELFITTSIVVDKTTQAKLDVTSTTTRIARIRRALTVGNGGEATYHYYQGNSAVFFHDGANNAQGTDGYFSYLMRALRVATDFIFISDWSFHPLFRPDRRASSYMVSDTIGYQLVKKAVENKNLLIAIHAWDHTNVGAPDEQNDASDAYLDEIARFFFSLPKRPPNLLWLKSSRTGIGYSHHQKFIVCDSPLIQDNEIVPDILRICAFLGGLDLTKGRFDWREHTILPDEPGAEAFYQQSPTMRGKPHDDWYNAELYGLEDPAVPAGSSAKPDLPRQPWHDVAVAIIGPSCYDIVREFVGRWLLNPANYFIFGDTDRQQDITDKFKGLFSRTVNPAQPYHAKNNPLVYRQQWHPAAGPWSVQVCRSMEKQHWEQPDPINVGVGDHRRNEFRWTVKAAFERSIQLSYLQAIGQAENFIYIETQYFISTGDLWLRSTVANQIARALADRAVERARARQPFHIYLVIPMFPEGDPGSPSNGAQRQFQWNSIRAMADRIRALTLAPWQDRLSVLFPARWNDLGGLPAANRTRRDNVRDSKRYPIYVHSKYILIDDRYVFIGSANLNERSLAGNRDSEIGVAMWASNDASLKQCISEARSHRESLWREHLGPGFPEEDFAEPGSDACIRAVRDAAAENYKAFREGRFDPDKHGHLCLWPLESDPAKASMIPGTSKAPENDDFIPDRPFGLPPDKLDIWRWNAPGTHQQGPLVFTGPGDQTAE